MRRGALAFAALLLSSCYAYSPFDFGGDGKPPDGLIFNVVEINDDMTDSFNVELELVNQSSRPFVYRGGDLSRPRLRYAYLSDVASYRPIILDCGTGMVTLSLAPGERTRISATVSKRDKLRRVRIGIQSEGFVLWSPVIDPATGKAGPPRQSTS